MVAVNCAKNSCLWRNSCFLWTKEGWIVRKHFRTLGNTTITLQVVSFLVFSPRKTPRMHFMHLYAPCDVIATKMMPPSGRAYPHACTVQVWSKLELQFLRYGHFCIPPLLPVFSQSDPYQTSSIWNMASELTPQQLITQSAQATANAIANVLTARMVSISLPVYDWDAQDAYHSFSIFCHTLENWLLLNCILPDIKDHLRYVFASLGTKSLEMHAQWMPTSSKEEQKVTKAKASAFLDWIQQGMTRDVNTHVHLGELKEIVARPGEDPQDLIAHIKTLMDHCEMINDEHHKHKLHCCIVHAYYHEGKLLGKLMAKPFNTPSNELADIAVNHFAIQHTREQVSHSSKMVDTIHQDKWQVAHTSNNSNGHTPSASSKDCPQLHPTAPSWQSKLPGMWFPIVPNVTRWDIGDQNAMVASHSNQGMHLHLGHSRGSPDAHVGTTTTAKGGATKQTL